MGSLFDKRSNLVPIKYQRVDVRQEGSLQEIAWNQKDCYAYRGVYRFGTLSTRRTFHLWSVKVPMSPIGILSYMSNAKEWVFTSNLWERSFSVAKSCSETWIDSLRENVGDLEDAFLPFPVDAAAPWLEKSSAGVPKDPNIWYLLSSVICMWSCSSSLPSEMKRFHLQNFGRAAIRSSKVGLTYSPISFGSLMAWNREHPVYRPVSAYNMIIVNAWHTWWCNLDNMSAANQACSSTFQIVAIHGQPFSGIPKNWSKGHPNRDYLLRILHKIADLRRVQRTCDSSPFHSDHQAVRNSHTLSCQAQ